MKHLIFTFFVALFFNSSYAQKTHYSITIINDANEIIQELNEKSDSLKFQKTLRAEYFKLIKKGHVLAQISIVNYDTLYKAIIREGKIYKWGKFNIDQIPEVLLSKSGYKKQQFNNAKINVTELGKLLTKVINEADYTGYPFAVIKLDSVNIVEEQISAIVNFSSGPQISYAKLTFVGDQFVKSRYLASYLFIKENDLFNSKAIESISKKINNLTYCKINKVPKIRFENKTCKVVLDISTIKANKIDAMIGLAPNQLDNSKMLATGYINLDLHNLFKAGKRLTFNWRQFGTQSQMLKALYNHTNLFGSPINVQGEFNLFKQDISFITRAFQVSIGIDKADYSINLTSNFISSRLLSNTVSNSINDLELIDFNAQYYGVEFYKNEFDHAINPTRGWRVRSGVNIGAKNILSTSFVPAEYYDSLDLQPLQGSLSVIADVAIPIAKIFVAYSKIELATISSSGKLFNNDLYRLGGVNSLRGFNELEIYASSYMMLQLEARLLLSENSRLFGFVDWAYSENEVLSYQDNFIGLGMGLLLDTPSGVIQLVYAVGKSSKQSLSLAESKIHFGYVARF